MKLHVEGEINRYYVQTLCMIFFPGAKFAESEVSDKDTPEVFVRAAAKDNGIEAFSRMQLGDKAIESVKYVEFSDMWSRERTAKIAVGRAVFDCGEGLFGYTPAWGILTGVRPSKLASELLLSGSGIQKAKRILREEYFVNPKKASLAVNVAAAEYKIINQIKDRVCSVYISIPFCPTRCAYCSFVSYTSKRLLSLIPEYLLRLGREIDGIFETAASLGLRVVTVYIGGGTPTVLSPDRLRFLLGKICSHTDPKNLLEFTLEAGRPDTISAEKLAVAKEYGVTRISVNPQILNDDVLASIGRRHSVYDFFMAYDIAKKSGIRDINVDLIAGLPTDTFASFSKSFDKILELRPNNITVHTFCAKKSADILKSESEIYSRTGKTAAKCVDYSQVKSKIDGYRPYYMYRQKNTVGNLENVGFALPGTEGLYNIFMMEEVHTILAAGAGAVTKLVDFALPGEGTVKIERIFNHKYPYEYLSEKESDKTFERIKKFYDRDR